MTQKSKTEMLSDGTLIVHTRHLDKIHRVIVEQGVWCKVFYEDEEKEEEHNEQAD